MAPKQLGPQQDAVPEKYEEQDAAPEKYEEQDQDALPEKDEDGISIGGDPTQSRPANLLESASLISRWLFLWVWPLLKVGASRPLQDEDLPELAMEDSSHYNRERILKLLPSMHTNTNKKDKHGQSPKRTSLFWAIVLDYAKSLWYPQVLLVIAMFGRIGQVLALQVLLDQLEDSSGEASAAYISACVMIFCGAVVFLCKQRQFFLTYRNGVQLRLGLVAAIYQKAHSLPPWLGSGMSAGQVTNLASNDVERYIMASVTGLYVWWGPLESLMILGVGIYIIGPAFAAGFGLFMTVLLPLQFYFSQLFAKLRQEVATDTDARINLVSQSISGARVMKMSAWELQLEKKIAASRATEVGKIIRTCRVKAMNESLYFISSLVVSVVVFVVKVATGGTLTSGAVFSTLTLVNILQYTMTKLFPMAIMSVSECYVSTRRIQEFLELPELDRPSCSDERSTADLSTPRVSLDNVTCHWDNVSGKNEDEAPLVALDNISFDFYAKSLYGIMGIVGSGKSGLLQALVGELPVASGTIQRQYKSIAYAAQDSWIMNGSVRENVLMGLPLREDWYHQVIEACALMDDIRQFSHGDATLLGDKGVQCSGGQRSRIGLARVFYRDSELIVLDDPMSAVDTKVGRWIYEKAIVGLGLERGKCIILATHQLHFLEHATQCILMEGGKISCQGAYEECIVAAHGAPLGTPVVIDDVQGSTAVDKNETHETKEKVFTLTTTSSTKIPNSKPENKEERTTGIVKRSTWIKYAQAMGGIWVAILLFIMFSLAQASILVSQVAIGRWAEQPGEEQDSINSLSIVLGLTITTVFIAIDRALLAFYFFNKASQRLHDRMTKSVLFSQISFTDSNPSGRVINRFSADVGIADEQLPLALYDCVVGLFMAFGSVATAVAVLPIILVALPPLLWYLMRIRRVFLSTTREVKRLEGLGRSPIFEMLGEVLNGISSIRSNGASDTFLRKFEAIHDAHTRAVFAFVAASRWFATRLEFVTFLLMAVSSVAAALLYDYGWIDVDPAVLGLALTLLLQLAGTNFPWIVRQSAEVVNQMVSVERISEYGDIPSEAPILLELDSTYPDWPSEAPIISLKNLTVRYQKDLPPALNNITVSIKGGEKVGVVGRTGSGKSTLVQALFRLLEADEGNISIDGVDISLLGLHKLRLAMSVIPQVPVLFRGSSVRENLDPFNSYTDEQIWGVLEDVQMTKVVQELSGELGAMVSEGGLNFSVGQRQLLCLARAILRKSSILVLDEATANIDSQTEASLKAALNTNFADATVIAIAHRLDTVMDYDRILVLGGGKVLEYGSPEELQRRENGHFASLVASQKGALVS